MPNNKKGSLYDKNEQAFSMAEKKLHFVGIGGVSTSSLAALAILSGAHVSGSDRNLGERTYALAKMGAIVSAGHSKENLPADADLVIYSGAISKDNPELAFAKEIGIPAVTRSSFLGALMPAYDCRIGISGTHGKSTTTAMLDAIFTLAGENPTTLAGENLPDTGSSLRVGGKGTMIYEACEYQDAFKMFCPTIAVALNLEMDHVDYYKDEKSIKDSFAAALSKATDFVLLNEDDENLFKIKKKITSRIITFSSKEESDYSYSIISFSHEGYSFSIKRKGKVLGVFTLNVLGAFNVLNAVAAAIVAIEREIQVSIIAKALKSFRGIKRRLERVGTHYGREVIYDYAHHPTEIAASIDTVKMAYPGEVTVIFRPHTYSRTEYFWREFRASLDLADHVILTDIYPAREEPIEGVTSENLAKAIGPKAIYCHDREVVSAVDIHTYGAIIVMGAGDLEDVKDRLLKHGEE